MDNNQTPRILINTNTYVSIGLIALIVGGIWAILNAVTSTRADMNIRFDKLEDRVKNVEQTKNTWSAVQMFQWAVHLQQLNSDPKKLQTEGLKVPEPEVQTK